MWMCVWGGDTSQPSTVTSIREGFCCLQKSSHYRKDNASRGWPGEDIRYSGVACLMAPLSSACALHFMVCEGCLSSIHHICLPPLRGRTGEKKGSRGMCQPSFTPQFSISAYITLGRTLWMRLCDVAFFLDSLVSHSNLEVPFLRKREWTEIRWAARSLPWLERPCPSSPHHVE